MLDILIFQHLDKLVVLSNNLIGLGVKILPMVGSVFSAKDLKTALTFEDTHSIATRNARLS